MYVDQKKTFDQIISWAKLVVLARGLYVFDQKISSKFDFDQYSHFSKKILFYEVSPHKHFYRTK